MLWRRKKGATFLVLFFCWLAAPATAGQGCKEIPLHPDYLVGAIDTAFEIERQLQTGVQQLAIIARVGSDISEQGLKYTHAAFVRRVRGEERWLITHMLNKCGSDEFYFMNHGLLEFMLDDLVTFDYLIAIPSPVLQAALLDIIESRAALKLVAGRYSLISNPLGPLKYQNSNHWMLDVLAMAEAKLEGETLSGREATQDYFLRHGYRGSVIKISGLRRLGATVARPNVYFDDHPYEAANSGEYEVVTVRSLITYLGARDPGVVVQEGSVE